MKKTAPYMFLIILFAAAAWYFFTSEPEAVHELPPPDLSPAMPAEEQQAEPQIEDSPAYREPVVLPDPLPLLGASDPELKLDLAEIAGADRLAEFLVKDQVISRVVATLDSLTSRQVPSQINPIRPAADKFIAETEGENVIMSTENFARYDAYVALMQDVNTDALVALYQRYYPLFQQAWEENGGEGSFNERLAEVINQLLETPDVPGPVYLSKPEAVYLFEERELEAMTAGQKILVRMGSVNAAVVKEKLTEVKLQISAVY
jgi:hypothetical protein